MDTKSNCAPHSNPESNPPPSQLLLTGFSQNLYSTNCTPFLYRQVALELLNEQGRAGVSQPIHHHLNTRAEIDAVLRNSTQRVLQYGHNLEQATSFWDLVSQVAPFPS